MKTFPEISTAPSLLQLGNHSQKIRKSPKFPNFQITRSNYVAKFWVSCQRFTHEEKHFHYPHAILGNNVSVSSQRASFSMISNHSANNKAKMT